MHNDKDLRGGLPRTGAEVRMPLTPAEKKAQEQIGRREGVEVVIDHDYISIPRSRYDDLLRAEAQLDMIFRFYGVKGAGYQISDLLEALFGPREDGDNA